MAFPDAQQAHTLSAAALAATIDITQHPIYTAITSAISDAYNAGAFTCRVDCSMFPMPIVNRAIAILTGLLHPYTVVLDAPSRSLTISW